MRSSPAVPRSTSLPLVPRIASSTILAVPVLLVSPEAISAGNGGVIDSPKVSVPSLTMSDSTVTSTKALVWPGAKVMLPVALM